MTVIRRVVSGHDKEGRAVVASDEQLSGLDIPGMSGFEILNIWGSDQTHQYPDDGSKPDYQNFFAPVGGYRFLIFTVPPDSPIEVNEADKPPSEMEAKFPGLLQTFKPDAPGMHRSATVDLLYVIEGRCELELDDGERVSLGAGDTFIQSGTMHAWRNPFDVQCKIIGVIVGAEVS